MSQESEPSPASSSRGAWTAVKWHLSLWIGLVLVATVIHFGTLFPGRGIVVAVLAALGGALVVMLWAGAGSEAKAKKVLHVLSLVLFAWAVFELALTLAPREAEFTRYPYPYRMQGAAPGETTELNRLGASTNDSGMRGPDPVSPREAGVFRVLILGGSTIFGVGSPDDQTPPAYLERILNERLRSSPVAGVDAVEVINAGMGWYNSTQEVVWLVTELLLYEPDLVVVVDGYNDAHHTVVWGNRPPANKVVSAMLENLYDTPGVLFKRQTWGQALLGVAGASRALKGIEPRALVDPGDFGMVRPETLLTPYCSRENEELMRHRLLMNWTLVRELGESLGFATAFALQPAIYSKSTLSEKELDWIDGKDYAEVMADVWSDLGEHVARRCAELGLEYFSSDVGIRDVETTLFTDYCHLVPEGNELLARAIAEALEPILRQGMPATSWDGIRYEESRGDPIWRPASLISSE